ncbi:MAG: DPP IV N-terminal domain-containing protein, partial [candidate division Zixibacteria bacterium]|nr:DPP IV N-terminal domain-containing protein [candidate division Zixibacteria bacterium]
MSHRLRYLLAILCLLATPAAVLAQGEYFGRNKVQYRDFKWEIISTPHFEIYYYQGEEEAAYDAARMAERSYNRLSRILQHRFSDKIPIILYASHTDFQQTNVLPGFISEGTGGVTEFNKNRILLPFTGSYAELEHVLTHELVHAFQGDVIYGAGPGVSILNPMAFVAPLWFMEGMAEYLSLGRIDAYTHMWLRDAALQGYLPQSIPAMDYSFGVYRFGQALFAYIGDRYGDRKIGEILRKTARMRNVNEAFRSSIGKDIEKLSDEWNEHVRKTYLPQIEDYEKPQAFARQLTDVRESRAGLHLAPAISPRGDKLVFISNRSLYNDIYLASAINGEIISKLVEGERSANFESLRFFSTSISWSPDEQYIAFPAKVGARDALYIMDVRRKKVIRRIRVNLDGATSPSWSPDGSKLVFVGLQGGQSDLYVVDAAGGNLKALTRDRYTDRDPVWSPDGKTIAFSTDRGEVTNFRTLTFGYQQLALYDLDSGEVEKIPDQIGKSISPQWSADGSKIAFISNRTGVSNIFIRDMENGETYQITNVLTGVTNVTAAGPAISWAQKSNRLVFSALSWGGFDLFSISDPESLMKEPYDHEKSATPGASPDAQQLAPPLRTEPPDEPLASEDAEGSSEETASEDAAPSISPDTAYEAEQQSGTREREKVTTIQTVLTTPPDTTSAAESAAPGEVPEASTGSGLLETPQFPFGPIAGGIGPAGELPDTTAWTDGTFKKRKYSPRFGLDYLGGNAGYSTHVGLVGSSVLSFSDILNNHNILVGANVFGSLTDANLLVQYTNLTRRINWSVAAFQYSYDLFRAYQNSWISQVTTQINRGVQFHLSRPFSKFNRFELGVQGVNRSRELVDVSFNYFGIRRTRRGSLGSVKFIQPTAALVTDHTLYGPTGPIAGARGRVEVTPTFGELQFTRVFVDYRAYYNVLQRYAFAFRLYGLSSDGRDQELYPFGGPFNFRGADYWSVWGSKVALVNAEFRFPLIEVLALGWPLPLAFQQIRGSLFVDAGAAWDQATSSTQANQYAGYPNVGQFVDGDLVRDNGLGPRTMEELSGGPLAVAYGIGMRSRVGFLILKFDIARQFDMGKRPAWYNNENLANVPRGLESEFPGTRSYQLRHALNDTQFFFTIGADF